MEDDTSDEYDRELCNQADLDRKDRLESPSNADILEMTEKALEHTTWYLMGLGVKVNKTKLERVLGEIIAEGL